MGSEIIHFFLKLNPPRSSFMVDMNENEREIMRKHVAYWAPFVEDGTVLVLGPVMDPAGGYGIAILGVESEARLLELMRNDPANGMSRYEWHPMRAVTKKQ
jgi:uncharacterized protein